MRIFLAAPLTQLLTRDGSQIDADFMTWWSSIIDVLEESGHEVISSHVREDWGRRLDPPPVALSADLQGIRTADLVIAYVGVPPSPGVQLEIGYAVGVRKPLIVFADAHEARPYLLEGLRNVAGATVHLLDHRDEMAASILELLSAPREAEVGRADLR